MKIYDKYIFVFKERLDARLRRYPWAKIIVNNIVVAVLTLTIFYLSLVTTSFPVTNEERAEIERAIALLEEKGFEREAFLLRRTVTFRGGGNWLNSITNEENAYAATNFPFGIITLYPDFYHKTVDDTERAMVLLHEARHLQGGDERDAYSFVWQNRERLGWTINNYGVTACYVTIEQLTRENAPELFTCPEKLFADCTVKLYNNTKPVTRKAIAEARWK